MSYVRQFTATQFVWVFTIPLLFLGLHISKYSQCELSFTLEGQGRMLFDPISWQITPIQPPAGIVSLDSHSWIVEQTSSSHLMLVLHGKVSSPEGIVLNPPDTDGSSPAWSPRGDLIAFTVFDNGSHSIYIVKSDGSGSRNLTRASLQNETETNIPLQDDFPAWSPSGNQIAFRSNRGGNDGLWLVNVDGSGLKQIAYYGGLPIWSPDGQFIAWQTTPNRIGVVDLAADKISGAGGGNVTRSNPIWSPDSRWLGFLEGGVVEGPNTNRPLGSSISLYKMHPDGTERTRVTPADLPISEARWAPDTDVIAFTSKGQLYLVAGDGTNLQPITVAGQVNALIWVCRSDPATATKP